MQRDTAFWAGPTRWLTRNLVRIGIPIHRARVRLATEAVQTSRLYASALPKLNNEVSRKPGCGLTNRIGCRLVWTRIGTCPGRRVCKQSVERNRFASGVYGV